MRVFGVNQSMRHCNPHLECPIQKNRNNTDNHDHTLTTTTTWHTAAVPSPLLLLPQSFIHLLSPTCSHPSPPEPCRSLLHESHTITATTKTQPRCMAVKQESGVTMMKRSLLALLSHKNRHTTAIPASLSPTTASFSLITCHLLNLNCCPATQQHHDDNSGQPTMPTTTADNQRC